VRQVVLERAAQEFADATSNPPHPFQLGPEEGNTVVGETQSGDSRLRRTSLLGDL